MAAVSCQLLEARQYLLMCDVNVNQAVEVFRSAIPSANHPRRQRLTRMSIMLRVPQRYLEDHSSGALLSVATGDHVPLGSRPSIVRRDSNC
jgi:hypothetical protein